jgi:translation elongation factor EF-1alpha
MLAFGGSIRSDTPPTDSRLQFGGIREAVIGFHQRVALERFRDVPSLGRFVLADRERVVACGVVNGPLDETGS